MQRTIQLVQRTLTPPALNPRVQLRSLPCPGQLAVGCDMHLGSYGQAYFAAETAEVEEGTCCGSGCGLRKMMCTCGLGGP